MRHGEPCASPVSGRESDHRGRHRKSGLQKRDRKIGILQPSDGYGSRQKGKVTTFAGSKKGCANGTLKKAKFNEPTGLYYYNGALYVADSGNHRICKIENGKVTTVAGSAKGVEGDKNGSALNARLSNPQEII